jgi:hypothetical protein
MDKGQSPQSFFYRLATTNQSPLRRARLPFSMLAIAYLFLFIIVKPGRGLFTTLAAWAVMILGAYILEDFRRCLYLRGRRSAHSLSGKLLS